MRRLWHSPLGRYLCQVLTLGEHVWLGWKYAGAQPGHPLPMAYCARCGQEF